MFCFSWSPYLHLIPQYGRKTSIVIDSFLLCLQCGNILEGKDKLTKQPFTYCTSQGWSMTAGICLLDELWKCPNSFNIYSYYLHLSAIKVNWYSLISNLFGDWLTNESMSIFGVFLQLWFIPCRLFVNEHCTRFDYISEAGHSCLHPPIQPCAAIQLGHLGSPVSI